MNMKNFKNNSLNFNSVSDMSPKLRFAVVCSSNMNRSMEAHNFLRLPTLSLAGSFFLSHWPDESFFLVALAFHSLFPAAR